MKLCIQNNGLPMKRDLENTVLSLRVRGPEAVRFWQIMDAAKQKNPYIDKSNVIRELLGLDQLNILTAADLKYFREGKVKKDRDPRAFQGAEPKDGKTEAGVLRVNSKKDDLKRKAE